MKDFIKWLFPAPEYPPHNGFRHRTVIKGYFRSYHTGADTHLVYEVTERFTQFVVGGAEIATGTTATVVGVYTTQTQAVNALGHYSRLHGMGSNGWKSVEPVRDDNKCECVSHNGPNPECGKCGGSGCYTG